MHEYDPSDSMILSFWQLLWIQRDLEWVCAYCDCSLIIFLQNYTSWNKLLKMDNDRLLEKSSGDSLQVKAFRLGSHHYNESTQRLLMKPHQSSCLCHAPFSLLWYKYSLQRHCLRLTITLLSKCPTEQQKEPSQWLQPVKDTWKHWNRSKAGWSSPVFKAIFPETAFEKTIQNVQSDVCE